MRRRILGLGMVLLLAGAAFAANTARSVKLTGYLIDNACSARANSEGGAEKVKNHTVKCAMMPNCEKSGYALYADGKLYKLDEAGNKKAIELYKSTKVERGLQVTVEGDVEGESLKVKNMAEVPAG
jgi:Mn-dependent DtxR family transcriptional regulator